MRTETALAIFLLSSAALFQLNVASPSHQDEFPVENTSLGPIRGLATPFASQFLRRNGTVYRYLGIPYAKPPRDERRFRPPEPVDAWDEVFNATEFPPFCPQVPDPIIETLLPGVGISEDCLHLNIYVPSTVPPNAPVMFFIHGGGFNSYGGSLFDSVPLALLGEVIVVTINYRLNILGFFSTGDETIPANLGLQDQRLALQWVHENIAAFGGNPDEVTIFGQSAGGASVGFHVVSAESRQFFRRAILQSGNPLNFWATPISPESAQETATLVAAAAECAPDLSGNSYIADCLRNKSVEELVDLLGKVQTDSGRVFAPVDDAQFLGADFATSIREGNFSDVEVLIGTTKDEGTYTSFIISGSSLSRPFFSREIFADLTTTSDNPLLFGLLETVYTSGIDQTGNYLDAMSDVFGDRSFTCGTVDFAKLVSAAGGKTYMYRMTLEPVESIFAVTWVKATHGDDLPLVFGYPFISESPVYDELKLSFYVIQMWSNFAKSGDPNLPVPLPKNVPEWPQFVPETELYKELDVGLPNNQRLRQHFCNFWNNLYPELLRLQAIAASGST